MMNSNHRGVFSDDTFHQQESVHHDSSYPICYTFLGLKILSLWVREISNIRIQKYNYTVLLPWFQSYPVMIAPVSGKNPST